MKAEARERVSYKTTCIVAAYLEMSVRYLSLHDENTAMTYVYHSLFWFPYNSTVVNTLLYLPLEISNSPKTHFLK